MSLDKSLKKAGSLARAECLESGGTFGLASRRRALAPEAGVYNLPKTKYRRLAPGQSGPKRPQTKG